MTTALVTGAAGFIGRHLMRALRERGAIRIVGADLRPPGDVVHDAWHLANLADAAVVRQLVAAEAPAAVFHLMGQVRGPDAAIRSSNVESARVLLDAVCAEAPRARVILVGSAAEYGAVPRGLQPVRETFAGAPVGAYGRAKREVAALAARYAHERGVHAVLARPANVIGAGIPDTLVVGAIVHRLRAAIAGPPPRSIRIGATDAIRDFVAAGDVADGFMRAADRGRAGEAYNLCSGEGHTVADVLGRLCSLAREEVRVRQDAALMRAGEVDALVCSGEKASQELGWHPCTTLDDALRDAWEFTATVGAAG
jgi:GDP-4-dehydro-6-deoxy-D-mannose reductase